MAKLPHANMLSEAMWDRREALALAAFNYDRVKGFIVEAAGRGFDGVRIPQAEPLSLDKTKAAYNLLILLDRQGYQPLWVDSVSGMERFSNNADEAHRYVVLLVAWGSPKGSIFVPGLENSDPKK
mgnify:CR=1 FL=1|jgi:hypothetical protein